MMKMIRAGALLYTILISFIIFIIILFFVQLSFLSNRYIDRDIIKDQLISDLKSSILIVLDQSSFLQQNDSKQFKLYKDSKNEIIIKQKLYGAFKIIGSKSKVSNISESISVMIGASNSNSPFAIFLPDINKELAISGNTFIRGDCSLPKLGVKQAIINGRGYTGDKLIHGKTQISSKQLPEVNKLIFDEINRIINTPNSDSIISISDYEKLIEINQEFSESLLKVYFGNSAAIIKKNISGKVILISEKSIYIDKSSLLNNIIVCAPFIKIETGFSGSLQLFASDSIQIESNVNLKHPSFISVLSESSITFSKITIQKNCNIIGSVLLNNFSGKQSNLHIAKNANIYGTIYCKGNTELLGNIYGSIYTNSFILKTPLIEYKNSLLDVKIDYFGRPKEFASAYILKKNNNNKIIKWLK